eukprot:414570_1
MAQQIYDSANDKDDDESVSISFSDKEEKEEDTIAPIFSPISFKYNNAEAPSTSLQITQSAPSATTSTKDDKQLGANLNRAKFMRSAPSLMRLLNLGGG